MDLPKDVISNIKELPNGDFVAIGDSLQDATILQNESKMKDCRQKRQD